MGRDAGAPAPAAPTPPPAPPLPPPPRPGFGGDITANAILEFVDAGHNLLLAGSTELSETMRSLATECGVDFDDRGTAVYDHFSRQAAGSATDSTLVLSSSVVAAPSIVGKLEVSWGVRVGGAGTAAGARGVHASSRARPLTPRCAASPPHRRPPSCSREWRRRPQRTASW
jgi:hypothetical protein